MSRSIDLRAPSAPPRFRFGPALSADPAAESGPNVSFKLLIVFLIVLYSSVARLYPQLEVLRPAMTIALGAIFMMIVELAVARRAFRLMWPEGYMLLAVLGVAAASSFTAIYARAAFNTTADLLKAVLIYIVMENTITSARRVRTILVTLVLGGMFPAVGNIFNYLQGKVVEGSRAAWVGVFGNPNESAYALVILVPIAAVLCNGARRWQQAVLCGIIATYLVSIYLTFSRGSLVGLFAVLAIFGWKQKSFAIRILMIALLVLALIAAGLFWNRKDNFDDIGSDTTFNQRIATIMAGVNMFQANPLLGVGPGCSIVAYPIYVPPEMHCGCQQMLVIHNSFIQVLSELGVLGFVPWMIFIGMATFHAWRLQRGSTGLSYALGLELALWGFLVCSLSGGFAYSWFPFILVALVAASKRISEAGQMNL